MLNCLVVGIGGFIGAVCRYLISIIPLHNDAVFPFKTLIINIAGAFIIGIIAAAAMKNPDINPKLLLLIKVGFCGGFTTFSTFALESYDMISGGRWLPAALYMVLSVTLSIAALILGEIAVGK